MVERAAIACAWDVVCANQIKHVSVTRMSVGVEMSVRSPDVPESRRTAVVTGNVTRHFISARVMKAGRERHAISQTALEHQTALIVDSATLL